MYETQLCFNENANLFRAENIADSILFLSGTSNQWILDLMYSNKPFIFQEDLILEPFDEEIERLESNSRFKADLFLLRFLILDNRSNIPPSFLSRAYSITAKGNLERRFNNDRLILLIQKLLPSSLKVAKNAPYRCVFCCF